MEGGVYCLHCGGWALGFLLYLTFFFWVQVEGCHNGNRTTNHFIWKWVPLRYYSVDQGHLGSIEGNNNQGGRQGG